MKTKIVVIKSCKEDYWYKELIGEKLEVYDQLDDTYDYHITNYEKYLHILKDSKGVCGLYVYSKDVIGIKEDRFRKLNRIKNVKRR